MVDRHGNSAAQTEFWRPVVTEQLHRFKPVCPNPQDPIRRWHPRAGVFSYAAVDGSVTNPA